MTANQHYIYAHTCSLIRNALFKACPVQRESHYSLISIIFSCQGASPAPRHPFFTLCLRYQPPAVHLYLQPPSSASFPHLWLSPLCPVLQCSPPHISLYSSSFTPPHQLLSPPILIRSTLGLLLAAFSFSTSALLPPSHCAPAHCMSLAPLLIYHLCVSDLPRWTLHLVNKSGKID